MRSIFHGQPILILQAQDAEGQFYAQVLYFRGGKFESESLRGQGAPLAIFRTDAAIIWSDGRFADIGRKGYFESLFQLIQTGKATFYHPAEFSEEGVKSEKTLMLIPTT